MKTVVDADTVLRLWRQQGEQKYATVSSRNFYFQDETLYSYGAHFPLARFIADAKFCRGRCVLLNDHRYSPTTAKHQSWTRRAVSAWPNWAVPDLSPDIGGHATNVAYFAEWITGAVETLRAARYRRDWALRSVLNRERDANAYLHHFRLRSRTWLPKDFDLAAEEALVHEWECKRCDRDERAQERDRLRQEAAAAAAVLAEALRLENIERWRAGLDVAADGKALTNLLHWSEPDRLRLKDRRIETLAGGEISIYEAKRLLPYILAGEEKHWHTWSDDNKPPRFGFAQLTTVNADGSLKFSWPSEPIPRSEIDRIIEEVAWLEANDARDVSEPASCHYRKRRRHVRLPQENVS